jgi:hypothetical protein
MTATKGGDIHSQRCHRETSGSLLRLCAHDGDAGDCDEMAKMGEPAVHHGAAFSGVQNRRTVLKNLDDFWRFDM